MKPFTRIPQMIAGQTVLELLGLLAILPVPERYVSQNHSYNLQLFRQEPDIFKPGSFIENQPHWSRIPFGCCKHHNMAYSGCEIIAVHNALLAMGTEGTAEEMAGLIRHFERKGAVLWGDFGVSPKAIYRYLRKEHTVELHCYRFGDAIEEPDGSQIVLISFFNDSGNLWKGIHTICVTHAADGYYLHNTYYQVKQEYRAAGPYKSLNEGLQDRYQGRISVVSTIIIQKGEGE